MSEVLWEPPGPGTWELDSSHMTRPGGRYFDDLYVDAYAAGFARGFAQVGVPVRTLEMRSVHGWQYYSVRPLGGPPEPKGPPPKLLMTVLFSVVPELRRRKQRASTLFVERPWRDLLRRWRERDEEVELSALRRLEAEDAAPHDDEELADLVDRVGRRCTHLIELHFEHGPAGVVAIGDFLVHAERWAGAPASRAARALAGFSDATRAPLAGIDAIVGALRGDAALDALDVDAHGVEAEIRRRSPAAATALDAYLERFGLHGVTGYTVFDATLVECPDVWVGTLRARAGGADDGTALRRESAAIVDELTAAVPGARRGEWSHIVADAQAMTHLRESDGALVNRCVGLARRTMLEVGRRLVDRGLADAVDSALDLTTAEAVAVLRGGGPDGSEIRAHTAERRAREALTPPAVLGPPAVPPPADRFPPAVGRVVEAVGAFVSRMQANADPIVGEGLAGHGVSPGVVEGTARLVRGPEDFAKVGPGDILVARTTAPTFNVVLAMASGLLTEVGGLVCHAAIIARELGIPGIVGCAGALAEIPDGARIRIDGDHGTVTVISAAVAPESVEPVPRPPAAPVAAPRVPDERGALVPLADARSRERFGGKASALCELLAGSIRVPPGVALDPDFTEAVAARDPEHLRELSAALDDLPGPWAVRSSGLSEDGVGASFAGQFTTVLGVADREACVAAVHEVWASAHAPGVTAYRERLGLRGSPRMAVVIQQLVDAEVAGVLFTEGDGEHLVEACWGLAEPLVSGEVEPDRFTLDLAGRPLSREIAHKPTELRSGPDGRTERREVAVERAAVSCLRPDQLAALARLAQRAEALFGGRQDLEFVFEPGGELVCVQSRPVTASIPEASLRAGRRGQGGPAARP